VQALWPTFALVFAGLSGLLSAYTLRLRRDLGSARENSERLRELVKKRVERPNVFSHEVRTPLTLIKGAAELLAEESPGPLTPMQREFVATIASNTDQMLSLAQDLLVEARLDSPLFDLHLERFDLRALVRQTVRDARRVHPTAIRQENTGGPLPLTADRALLGQALWNLVNNACRHAGPHSTLTVSASRGEGQAVLAVADDGVGMTPQEREGLFRPFASNGEHAGTGLGMMITERIINQHGGRLLVDSIPGRGTTIFCTLPLAGRTEAPHE
jgi:two-component system, OmpR family, sensor kinase